jgi:hypothetical protein
MAGLINLSIYSSKEKNQKSDDESEVRALLTH